MAATRTSASSGAKTGNGRRVQPANGAARSNGANGAADGKAGNGKGTDGKATVDEAALRDPRSAWREARDATSGVRPPARRTNLMGQIGAAFNEFVEMNARATRELSRVG